MSGHKNFDELRLRDGRTVGEARRSGREMRARINAHVYAEARQLEGDSWYVYWETSSAFGSRGANMTEQDARDLAARINSGEDKPYGV